VCVLFTWVAAQALFVFPGNFETAQRKAKEAEARKPRRQQIVRRFKRNAEHKISLMSEADDDERAQDEIKSLRRKFLDICDDLFEDGSTDNDKCRDGVNAKARRLGDAPVERKADELEKRADKKEEQRETKRKAEKKIVDAVFERFEFALGIRLPSVRALERARLNSTEILAYVKTLKTLKQSHIDECKEQLKDGEARCGGLIQKEAKQTSNTLQQLLREALDDEKSEAKKLKKKQAEKN
jgi:hypothetical protein